MLWLPISAFCLGRFQLFVIDDKLCAAVTVEPEHLVPVFFPNEIPAGILISRRPYIEGMNVAVDAANEYAKRIYDAAGFRETDRRVGYILLRPERSGAASEAGCE